MFPKVILEIIDELDIEEVKEAHRDSNKIYLISNKYVLKISNEINSIKCEYEKDLWISRYINSPKPVCFVTENNKVYYLKEYIDGETLINKKYLTDPIKLIDLLVEGLNIIHNSKVLDKKFINDINYDTLIHGDYCLPNILVKEDKVVGFVDLGDAGIGDPWYDYAWCIWSLEYNLKTKDYTPLLLEKLGIEFNEEKFNKYTSLV